MSAGPLAWQVGKWVLIAVALAAFGLTVFVAFARRDHKVELIVTYAKSPPNAVWRLLTDHASEPKWLPAFGTVVRQPDIDGGLVGGASLEASEFAAMIKAVAAL